MHVVLKALMPAGLAALAACSTPPATQTAPAPAEAAQKIAAAPTEEPMTGSRIRKRNSDGGDRTVKTVGSREARDALDSAMRPLSGSGQ